MPVDASKVLTGAFSLCKDVYSRLKGISENDEARQRIEKQLKTLEKIANDLKEFNIGELPETCNLIIETFNNSLEICKRSCSNLDKSASVKKFVFVVGQKEELKVIESELKKACDNLQLALQHVSVLQGRRIEEAVQQGTVKTNRTAVNPREGFYVPNRQAVESKPCQIEEIQVSLDESGELMEVKWSDFENPKQNIVVLNYEIRYDDENQLTLSAACNECMLTEDLNKFQIKLGTPKIEVGNTYTVQVRGINGAGAGHWSEAKIFRFKIGPPSKPKKPSVTVLSPTEILITAKRLSEREENGSCVTMCKVEYTEKIDGDSSTWSSLEVNIKQRNKPDVKLKIGGLTPHTIYSVRVKMINSVGESYPSDSCEVTTNQLIPGPPQGLRISSRRKATYIKIRWEEPAKNPQAVAHYKVQMRQLKKVIEWEDHETVEKKSAKFTDLKTDTKYEFRVRSVNSKGEFEDWSDSIEAETRFGLFGRTVGTIGAFIGGTLGGPFIGAVGGGVLAGTTASKVPDSEAGKTAAKVGAGAGGAVVGGLFGILGAPLVGGMTALTANKKLCGELEDISPQTSEDESETGLWTDVLKNSNKMAEDVFETDKKK